jgi:hypothetical protein
MTVLLQPLDMMHTKACGVAFEADRHVDHFLVASATNHVETLIMSALLSWILDGASFQDIENVRLRNPKRFYLVKGARRVAHLQWLLKDIPDKALNERRSSLRHCDPLDTSIPRI